MDGTPDPLERLGQLRRQVAVVVIGSATALSLGMTLKGTTLHGANDISRWCTVWALLERGAYSIDECPWSARTPDKVFRPAPFQRSPDVQKRVWHYYSSKPPLLPTLVAAIIAPWRALLGVPLERVSKSGRVTWPAHVLYLKPVVLLLNVVPFALFLVGYARFLRRWVDDDWTWLVSLAAAAWGTPLLAFNVVLNNHTVAAYSAFFALDAALRLDSDRRGSRLLSAAAGFFAALCACTELPAAFFGILLFVMLLRQDPGRTLRWFVPAAAIPCAAFLATQYAATGGFVPVYAEFNTASYLYPGSYWWSPSGTDALRESKAVYAFHLLFGHHGVFSLTPIFLFSTVGAVRLWSGPRPVAALARLTAVVTAATVAFCIVMTNNYGGSTQGPRWLFWLMPAWLMLLPFGLPTSRDRPALRLVALATLFASVGSTGYALTRPWSHPWILDLMEHLGISHVYR